MAATSVNSPKHKRTVVRAGLLVFLAVAAGLCHEVAGLLLLRSRGVETTVEVTGDTYVHSTHPHRRRRGPGLTITSTDEGFKDGRYWYYGRLDEDNETRLFRFEQPVTVGLSYPIVRDPRLVRTFDGGFYVGRKTDSLWTIYGNTEGTTGIVSWLAALTIFPVVAVYFTRHFLGDFLPQWRAERAALRPQSIGDLLKDD